MPVRLRLWLILIGTLLYSGPGGCQQACEVASSTDFVLTAEQSHNITHITQPVLELNYAWPPSLTSSLGGGPRGNY